MSHLSQRATQPAYYTVDCRIYVHLCGSINVFDLIVKSSVHGNIGCVVSIVWGDLPFCISKGIKFSFEPVDFYPKIYLILFPRGWNSTTDTAINSHKHLHALSICS